MKSSMQEYGCGHAALKNGIDDGDSYLVENEEYVAGLKHPTFHATSGVHEYATMSEIGWGSMEYICKGHKSVFGASIHDLLRVASMNDNDEMPDTIDEDGTTLTMGHVSSALVQSPVENLTKVPSFFYLTINPGEAVVIPSFFMYFEIAFQPTMALSYNVCTPADLKEMTPQQYKLQVFFL